jgi:hypothetical protein
MTVFVVSGLPRSGTSLMMQMLAAGGLEILADDHRPPDADNPRGYFEYEPVKALKRDNAWLPQAEGKAVKVIAALLPYLPPHLKYKIILMKRDLDEVLASQGTMLQRLGRQGSSADNATLKSIFSRQIAETERWLTAQPHLEVLTVDYRETLTKSEATARRVADFLGLPLDLERMAAVIDPSLYRQRSQS